MFNYIDFKPLLEFFPNYYLQVIDKIIELIRAVWIPAIIIWLVKKYDLEVSNFISRIIKFTTPGGLSFDAAQEQQEEEKKEDNELETLAREIETSQNVRDKLFELLEETNKTKEEVTLLLFFEKIYRLIFGTQLKLLNNMILSDGKCSLTMAIISHRASGWNEKGYDFNNWIGFLTKQNIITYVSGTNQEDCYYEITNLGKLFMSYLALNKISLNKPN
jgi:hypothetical protein